MPHRKFDSHNSPRLLQESGHESNSDEDGTDDHMRDYEAAELEV